jgi:hypothetical protein
VLPSQVSENAWSPAVTASVKVTVMLPLRSTSESLSSGSDDSTAGAESAGGPVHGVGVVARFCGAGDPAVKSPALLSVS